MKKLGLAYRRCGLMLGKALHDDKQGCRAVLFIDAAHFVIPTRSTIESIFRDSKCCVRKLLPSASGRQRFIVLGAYDPIRHETITCTNDTYINQEVFCEFFDKATELGIELLYLPFYSSNLNLIERLWRFVKKQLLYSTHYDKFQLLKNSIDTSLAELGTRFRDNMQSLMTMNFQLFSEKTEKLAV